jgi:anti-sigma factor RsiW
MDARVEAYIDDSLPPSERAQFEARLWSDPHWEMQVERARSIRSALQSQCPPSPPSELTDAILQHVSASHPSTAEA